MARSGGSVGIGVGARVLGRPAEFWSLERKWREALSVRRAGFSGVEGTPGAATLDVSERDGRVR